MSSFSFRSVSAVKLVLLALLLAPTMAFAATAAQSETQEDLVLAYPSTPESSVTPGSLCDQPDAYRYPEKIAYCNRSVEREFKKEIIKNYDEKFGYQIQSMPRQLFKIDHFIPLCAGGSNRGDNLWPQHESVYSVTDPLEPLVCQRMSEGKLLQVDAVRMIREAKLNLSKVAAILEQLQAM